MNCAKCPHLAAIRAALAPCQKCEAGELHGEIHANGDAADWALASRRPTDHTLTEAVTNLSPEDEDALRKAMASLFDLEPVELLLVQHLMHGGGYADFATTLAALLRRLRSHEAQLTGRRGGFRALAHSWGERIKRKFPAIAPVIKAKMEFDK